MIMKLSIVTPTFNESMNIVPLVNSLQNALREIDYEIIVVDDNSPDRTWEVAERLALVDPRIRELRRMTNPGLGEAVIDGFRMASVEAWACIELVRKNEPALL